MLEYGPCQNGPCPRISPPNLSFHSNLSTSDSCHILSFLKAVLMDNLIEACVRMKLERIQKRMADDQVDGAAGNQWELTPLHSSQY